MKEQVKQLKQYKKIQKEIRDAKHKAQESYVPTEEEQKILDYAAQMEVTDYTTAEGLEALARNHPEIYAAYTSKIRNASKAKGIENDTWYRAGDTKNVSDRLIREMSTESGNRSQSWSDFQVIHLMDYIAAVIEFSVRDAKMQSYTKVTDFVRLMGKTGAMINMSLIPSAIFEGKLVFDPKEGMPLEEALKLRFRLRRFQRKRFYLQFFLLYKP